MRRNSIRGYAVLGILFIVVSVVVFAVPTEKSTAVWIAYVFATIAFLAQIVIWKETLGRETELKSKFLGLSIINIGIIYLIIQNITLIVFLVAPALPIWSAIIASVIVAGVSAVCMIAGDTGSNEIGRVDMKVRKKVLYIKEIEREVELLIRSETDELMQTELMKLAEKIQFSDPMSSEQLADLEMRIAAEVEKLKNVKDKAETIGELNLLLDERNKKCRMLK